MIEVKGEFKEGIKSLGSIIVDVPVLCIFQENPRKPFNPIQLVPKNKIPEDATCYRIAERKFVKRNPRGEPDPFYLPFETTLFDSCRYTIEFGKSIARS